MKTPAKVPGISAPLLGLFSRYAEWFLRRHFQSIRLLGSASPNDPAVPLVVFLNHASWWDPLVCLFLQRRLFPRRAAYAPIDATALERYRILKKIGFFPVEKGFQGAARFLTTSRAILAEPANALFMTPQGKFADVRASLHFKPGIEHLLARWPAVQFLPLAIEYSFWEERQPEILLGFGEPIRAQAGSALSSGLAQVQGALAAAAIRRVPQEWTILLRGKGGVGGAYDLWRWLRAGLRRKAFRAQHGQL